MKLIPLFKLLSLTAMILSLGSCGKNDKFDSKIKAGNIHLKIEISRAKVYAFNLQ